MVPSTDLRSQPREKRGEHSLFSARVATRRTLETFLSLLLLAVFLPHPASAAERCMYPLRSSSSSAACANITWPTDAQWRAISAAAEPGNDYTGSESWVQLYATNSLPGIYGVLQDGGTNAPGDYLFFRLRTNYTGSLKPENDWSDVVWIYLSTSIAASTPPEYALGWDTNAANNNCGSYSGGSLQCDHGLEMQALATSATTWSAFRMRDWDDDTDVTTDYHKGKKDIDGPCPAMGTSPWGNGTTGALPTTKEGFVRIISQSDALCGGTTCMFIDMAVKCSYFEATHGGTAVGLPNLCTTSNLYVMAATQRSVNDHQALGSDVNKADIARGLALTKTIEVSDWVSGPTAAVVGKVESGYVDGRHIASWETFSEVGTAGFNLYRVDPSGGDPVQVNGEFIPALFGSPQGGTYALEDPGVGTGESPTYLVEEIESSGETRWHGPFVAAEREPTKVRSAEVPGAGTGVMRAPHPTDMGAPAIALAAMIPGNTRGPLKARVSVRQSALTRLGAAEIAATLRLPLAEVTTRIRSGNLRLSRAGETVTLFRSADAATLYFWGEALDSVYTDTNVYWLESGRGEILDLKVAQWTPGAAPAESQFIEQAHAEENQLSASGLFHDPEGDFWVWQTQVAADPVSAVRAYPLAATMATGGAGSLTVHLVGVTRSGGEADHRVAVRINGTPVGETAWTGIGPYDGEFTVPAGVLLDGENSVELTALLDPGVPRSIVALESFDLVYPRRLRAVGDRLLLHHERSKQVAVGGFRTDGILAFDLAVPGHPRALDVASGGPQRNSWARFPAATDGGLYLVTSATAAVSPAAIEPVAARSIPQAEYLVITAPAFVAGAELLADLRRGSGLTAAVVPTDLIYEKYSDGMATPHAFQAFLADALATWRQAPRFVVLAGNGSIDYRNFLGRGDSLVPPLLLDTAYGLAPSDVLLADVEGDDGIPEVAIGRIPALTVAELTAYADKLAGYESAHGAWTHRAILLSDRPGAAGSFEIDSDYAAALLPAEIDAERIYLDPLGIAEARGRLMAALDEGAVFVNYLGHGGVDRLASEGLLASADVPSLHNTERLPVVAAMTCVVGNFGISGYDSLGEALVKSADGGAIAVWAPTSLAAHVDSRALDDAFIGALFGPDPMTVGEAAVAAARAWSAQGADLATLRFYALLGDPAVVMWR